MSRAISACSASSEVNFSSSRMRATNSTSHLLAVDVAGEIEQMVFEQRRAVVDGRADAEAGDAAVGSVRRRSARTA